MSSSGSLTIFSLLVFAAAWCYSRRKVSSHSSRLPPGPQALPFLGNVHQLPSEHQERTFAAWGKKYGGLVYAKMFGRPVLVINSLDIARDLMENRSKSYSGRPRLTLMVEMLGWEGVTPFLDNNDHWKKQRKWLQSGLSNASVVGYRPILERESSRVLFQLLKSPHQWKEHLIRYTGAIMLEIAYGHQAADDGCDFMELSYTATKLTAEAGNAGSMLVDFFPILKYYPLWLPGSGFKSSAIEAKRVIRKSIESPFNDVKRRMALGIARPSIAADLLEKAFHNGTADRDEADIMGVAITLYAAGTETTDSVLNTFILAMVIHQDILEKAQEEVDRVVGHGRLPDLRDRESLPYIQCIILEIYRYLTPLPLGVPHRVTKDDEYQGYFIPKDSMLLGNMWGIAHDENIYTQPDRFLPERFLISNELNQNILDPRSFVFGFGRRICPGRELANDVIFLIVARIIATMAICRMKDERGREVVPPFALTSGLASHPKPFDCIIKTRSQKAASLISQSKPGDQ